MIYCLCMDSPISVKRCKEIKKEVPAKHCEGCSRYTDNDMETWNKRMQKNERTAKGNRDGRLTERKEISVEQTELGIIDGEDVQKIEYKDKSTVYRYVLWLPRVINDAIKEQATYEKKQSAIIIKDILRKHYKIKRKSKGKPTIEPNYIPDTIPDTNPTLVEGGPVPDTMWGNPSRTSNSDANIPLKEIKKIVGENPDKFMSKAALFKLLRISGSYWEYNEKRSTGPHALLTRGTHSNSFVWSDRLLSIEAIRKIFVEQLAMKIEMCFDNYPELGRPDYIVGVPNGGTLLAIDVGKILNIPRIDLKKVKQGFTCVYGDGPAIKDPTFLVLEDIITTGWSVNEVIQTLLLTYNKATLYSRVFSILNRGGLSELHTVFTSKHTRNISTPILSLIDEEMEQWERDECPLCKEGSEALPPKKGNNWLKLQSGSKLPKPKVS